MHAVEVRDRIMIAHSFRGEMFGPAQALHGATFVIDAAYLAEALDPNGVVIDIGRAHEVLRGIVKDLNYRNLDDIPEFGGFNTTTEFLTRYIFDRLADARLDALLAPAVPFAELPVRIPQILAPVSPILCQLIDYPKT